MKRGDVLKAALAASIAVAAGAPVARANPVDGGLYFQAPATEVAAEIVRFHDFLLVIITAISALVLALLVWVVVRYNRAANPSPRRFSHNTTVEVVWTVVPVIILIAISVWSFPLLAREERPFGGADVPPEQILTVKVIGHSWNWEYDLPDHGVNFTSLPAQLADLEAQGRADAYRMAVDAPLYVPVGTYVRVLVTSADVIHSWSMPQFGVKEDAIPGRVNEGWFQVREPGVYYGFCQELCGINHAFMPIEVRAVPREEFDAWVLANGGALPGATAPAPAEAAPAAEPVTPL